MPKHDSQLASRDPDGQPKPQRRSSKACETCRLRRIRCVGPPPCEACHEAGIGHSCVVRLKARPRRALSAKLQQHAVTLQQQLAKEGALGGMLPSPPGSVSINHNSPPSDAASSAPYYDRRNPVDQIQTQLARWCNKSQFDCDSLLFKPESHLNVHPATPLPPPPILQQFEDALMEGFVISQEFTQIDHLVVDKPWLLSLYGRYRNVPHSLTDDQTALIYATLCVSRFSQIRASMNQGTTEPTREDVTYFHMATKALARWGRSSVTALRALLSLCPFSFGMSGSTETRAILKQLAQQVLDLGLHRHSTAALYEAHDQAQALFSAYFYADLFRALLTDLTPCIPLIDIDVDPNPPEALCPPARSRPSFFTAKFLADYADHSVDMTSLQYVTSTEALWMPHLRQLRHGRSTGQPRFKIVWSELRYSWLRILLYIPLTWNAETAHLAFANMARSASQIIYSYQELISYKQLHPSWPQVQRLVLCGHVLILCVEAGEFHLHEAATLFQMLVDALEQLQLTWPVCTGIARGFARVAGKFGIDVTPVPAKAPTSPLRVEDIANIAASADPFQWNDLGLEFDLSTFPV